MTPYVRNWLFPGDGKHKRAAGFGGEGLWPRLCTSFGFPISRFRKKAEIHVAKGRGEREMFNVLLMPEKEELWGDGSILTTFVK